MKQLSTAREEGAHQVMLYCDDLVLSPESEIQVFDSFNMCKAAMERKELKVNNGKMKIIVSGKECDSVVTLENTLVKSVVVVFVVNSVRCIECTN